MEKNLFVYGTLLVPEIWQAVTGEGHGRWLDASLPGYLVRRVRGADFPAISPSAAPGDAVPGRVALGVSAEALARLDAYEDAFYERREVAVETGGGLLAAEAYVVVQQLAPGLLGEEGWTLKWFRREALDRYLEGLGGPGGWREPVERASG